MASDKQAATLLAAFSHIVLPPKLPTAYDGDDAALRRDFGNRLVYACRTFRSLCPDLGGDNWETLDLSLRTTLLLNQDFLAKGDLLRAFRSLDKEWLALHIAKQNAALIVRRDVENGQIVFEAFEVSAPNTNVLEANHALTCEFPHRAAAISFNNFADESFLQTLSNFLEQASSESFDQFAARASKGGKFIVETRDCPSPALISEMLMSLLEGIGSLTKVQTFQKKVRDDVVLGTSEIPWRRSPYWLFLRVAVRCVLSSLFDNGVNGIGRVYFKFIMCVVLAQLLKDCVGRLAPEKTLMLQAKLCRRLAKLETEKLAASGVLRSTFEVLFTATTPFLQDNIAAAQSQASNSWNEYKKKITRPIPKLPSRAPKDALWLDLRNSGEALSQLLTQKTGAPQRDGKTKISSLDAGTISQVNQLASRYGKLVDDEADIATQLKATWSDARLRCIDLSWKILEYRKDSGDAYKTDALLMSRHLLRLFELWVAMDQAATTACPLLNKYHPIFIPEALDVLCLLTEEEMRSLRDVQEHLAERIANHDPDYGSIFDTPNRKFAFPLKFVHGTKEGKAMIALGERIDAASDRARRSKTLELESHMADYNKLSEAIGAGVCCCKRLLDGTKDVRGCKRCWQWRSRNRMKIKIHEDFIPDSDRERQRAAILFELTLPEYLASYRNATWKLRMMGAESIPVAPGQPALLLGDYDPLKPFGTLSGRKSLSITLASEKKSFLQTHYKELKLPKTDSQVVLEFAPSFYYYDSDSNVWADDICKEVPWFQHLLGHWLPKGVMDPYKNDKNISNDALFPPSSYQIAANASECPSNMSVQEYSAFQRVVSGRRRRWLVILVELGATTLNFSSETTINFLGHLALQAGPAGAGLGVLGEVHKWFTDRDFCIKLHEQLHTRLETLVSNWREVHYMGILVTFTLRLHHLGSPEAKKLARALLVKIREITSGWIIHLRREIRVTNEADTARQKTAYAFRAALLCRQTFSIYNNTPETLQILGYKDMIHFFRASIAIQENLIVNLDELSPNLKILFIRDLSMSHSMRFLLERWALSFHSALEHAINETWGLPELASERKYSGWSTLSQKQPWWIQSQIAGTRWAAPQVVQYHVLQGHLLVDGKSLGKLPLEMREDPSIQELFGKQHLLTRPSGLQGMEYQLVSAVNDHEVHMGFRNGKVVIRAIFKNALLEHVPRAVFKSTSGMDLPSGLVDDCVHWLNLNSGMLEMRRKPQIWRRKPSNWTLDIRKHACTRGSGSYLVEPQSKVGRQISAIFRGFEDVEKLTIYQPMGGRLRIEMKRLEIQFFVNYKNLLQCPQLASEVDPDQDAGTLHGLESKIVLRSVRNPDQKSILVPIGSTFNWKTNGMHVAVCIANEGMYARFTVDTLLGRLDCAQEMPLLHLKAALHALTSFPIPDTLTGRTGTEEAVHCLTSACSQPWQPLQGLSQAMLFVLTSLSPKRHYYPKDSKFCQKVEWDSNLTATIQHEGLAPAVEMILRQSRKLEKFQVATDVHPTMDPEDDPIGHLRLRGLIRRQIYERINSPSDSLILSRATQWIPYAPQGLGAGANGCPIYQIVKELGREADEIPKLAKLSPLFKGEEMVGGFHPAFENLMLQEILGADIIAVWGKVVQTCRKQDSANKFTLPLLLALLATNREPGRMKMILWLVAIAKHTKLRQISPPSSLTYSQFQFLEKPNKNVLTTRILEHQSDYIRYLDTLQTKKRPKSARTLDTFKTKQRAEAEEIAQILVGQWPTAPGTAHELQTMIAESSFEFIDVNKAWNGLKLEVRRLSHNHELSCYLKKLQDIADEIPQHKIQTDSQTRQHVNFSNPNTSKSLSSISVNVRFKVPELEALLAMKACREFHTDMNPDTRISNNSCLSQVSVRVHLGKTQLNPPALQNELKVLSEIIDTFVTSTNATRKQYGQDLKESLGALIQHRQTKAIPNRPPDQEEIILQIRLAKKALEEHVDNIKQSISQDEVTHGWLSSGGLWPSLSPVALLEMLRNDNVGSLGPDMKEALVWYGVLITKLQRLQRMDDAFRSDDERRLVEEYNHTGHFNWRPLEQPEWLLLEIDNNILLRQSQVDVAHAIVSPSSRSNSVLQMNMGEGKTSCIMPMAATLLADKTKLCRLIVPRALLLQTALVIQRRLGRLIGRRVQHIPFQRRSPKGSETLDLYQRIHRETLTSGGVMLCLPEHILSFQLSGLQQLADDEMKTAKKMNQIQQWLYEKSRDIIDESDLTLSAKTQLIYPSGIPVIVDGHPQRWEVVQDVLSLVEGHCSLLESTHTKGIQIFRRHQGYPIIHFLDTKVEDVLNELLVKDVCDGRLARVQLKDPSDADARKALEFILTSVKVSDSGWSTVAKCLTDEVVGLKCLYLLRGLISERIILLCLKKRWNVQFGLHPERAPIAVPFEAKGVPSQTAEYGHPDTALTLTCLAFYQTGLSRGQITQSLEYVIRADDPAAQYEHWVHGCAALPATLRHVNLLSVDDEAQIEELWKHLCFDRHVLNHYMNHFVFPRHAKQFGIKLQASGWDIPLVSPGSPSYMKSSQSSCLTTGFSGTNDNKRLLPQTIKQDDLAGLVHTNAEVLGYLLENRNKTCYQAVDQGGKQLSERGLLELLRDKEINVLIDAGAHILEMENHDLAAAWLDVHNEAQGAVYFDKSGRIMVCARFQKAPMPLLASPFAENLEQCVVYVDEAHTRGTDIKLPLGVKGAVTLGMGQTKDQTVQAAMRLRQLASTQSVAFVAPPAVYQSILELRPSYLKQVKNYRVSSHDVVRWLLEQSCTANEDIMSLYIAQGFDFCRRANAFWKNRGKLDKRKHIDDLLEVIRQREAQSIEELYGSRTAASDSVQTDLDFPNLNAFNRNLHEQMLNLHQSGRQFEASALAEVEQEREVEFEVEQVRENQKREKFSPLSFPGLDPYITRFVETGHLDHRGPFIQAFNFIGTTKIGRKYGVCGTGTRLFISQEFTKTVTSRSKAELMMVRPVEWILWSSTTETALIVIPEEAELLIETLRTLDEPQVWLLSYAAPVTKSMEPFNTLNFFTVPSLKERPVFPVWLSVEVGVVAGRLYFDYLEYDPLLAWLGVNRSSEIVSIDATDQLQSFVTSTPERCGLSIKMPLKFLFEWSTYRRETLEIKHTPVGFVCESRVLKSDHSFFTTTTGASEAIDQQPITRRANGHQGDKEDDHESDDDVEWDNLDDGMGMDGAADDEFIYEE
ncbi:unnamed protein product [Clonostachys chloroleuca]|uniref:ubiquitinyl hydrolase 1 n=1 Tax=Clonostachys chloroleuca TaxID=1926264 RepID=A0AA35MD98_9HYPO|nr:unnamed protein product [Clonostachys chloroleuca]